MLHPSPPEARPTLIDVTPRSGAATRRLLVVADLALKKRGSLEQQLAGVATRLAAAGIATHLLVSRVVVPAIADALAATGAEVDTLPCREPWRAAVRLGEVVRALRPDIVHLHFFRVFSPVALAARASGARVVLNDHLVLRPTTSPLRRIAKRALGGAAGHLVDRRVAISALVARSIEEVEACPPDHVRIIENGIDLARFDGDDSPDARHHARVAIGLEGADLDRPIVAVIARMAHEKGVDVAIRALARLHRLLDERGGPGRRPLLLVAGDGPDRAACDALARDLGVEPDVRFLGLRDDVERVLAAADQAWVPSREEAFGLSAAEAMAAGRPVIASRAGALPEVVLDGDTGLLVPVDDPAALALAAASLLEHPSRAAAMGTAGRMRAAARYALDSCVDRVLDLYDELCPAWGLRPARAPDAQDPQRP